MESYYKSLKLFFWIYSILFTIVFFIVNLITPYDFIGVIFSTIGIIYVVVYLISFYKELGNFYDFLNYMDKTVFYVIGWARVDIFWANWLIICLSLTNVLFKPKALFVENGHFYINLILLISILAILYIIPQLIFARLKKKKK